MPNSPTGAYSFLSMLAERLGGHVDAWIIDEDSQPLPNHEPVTVVKNCVSATYELAAGSRFRMCWRAARPITALCAIVSTPVPGANENYLTRIYSMDNMLPQTQAQVSHDRNTSDVLGWFSSPPAGEKSFVQLEVRKAIKSAEHPLGYVPDPQEISYPFIVLRFNLMAVASTLPRFISARNPSPEPVVAINRETRKLVERLGGDVDAWLTPERPQLVRSVPATVSRNHVYATYELAPRTRFRVSWKARSSITAVCSILRPPLPGRTENCRVAVHVMDNTIPHTQSQTSEEWFSSPPAGEKGFIQLEVCKAVRTPEGHVIDPQGVCPFIVTFSFKLVGASPAPPFTRFHSPSPEPVIDFPVVITKRKRASDVESFCVRPAKKTSTSPATDLTSVSHANANVWEGISETVVELLVAAIRETGGLDLEGCWRKLKQQFGDRKDDSRWK